MKGPTVDALHLLQEAIEAEVKAHERYLTGAREAEDPETRALFEDLAADEAAHRDRLTQRLKALKLLKSMD